MWNEIIKLCRAEFILFCNVLTCCFLIKQTVLRIPCLTPEISTICLKQLDVPHKTEIWGDYPKYFTIYFMCRYMLLFKTNTTFKCKL